MKKLSAAIAALIVVSVFVGQSAARAEEGEAGAGAGMGMPAWMVKTPEHAAMAKSVGEFDVVTEMTMMPGAPAQIGKATATREVIMNGNYVQEIFKGTFGGMPFEGRLLSGYDTVRKKFVSVWYDNSSPVPSISYGTMKDGKLVFVSQGPNMQGQLEGRKMIVTYPKDGTSVVTFFAVKADGTEHQEMKLTYTPKAKAKAKAGKHDHDHSHGGK